MPLSDTFERPAHADPGLHALRTTREGLIAGATAAGGVAAAQLLVDLATGAPLRTPAVLEAFVFRGAEAAAAAEPGIAALARYSALHVGVWIGLGLASAWAITVAERVPRAWGAIFATLAIVVSTGIYAAGAFSLPGTASLQLWLGTAVGCGALAWVLVRRHPHALVHPERAVVTDATLQNLAAALACERDTVRHLEAAATRFPEAPALGERLAHRARRMQSLQDVYEHFDLAVPVEEAGASEAPATLALALDALIARERETVAMYDRFLLSVEGQRLRDVFLALRYQSADEDLPALESAREGAREAAREGA